MKRMHTRDHKTRAVTYNQGNTKHKPNGASAYPHTALAPRQLRISPNARGPAPTRLYKRTVRTPLMAHTWYHPSSALSSRCSRSVPSALGFSRCLSRASPVDGRLAHSTVILPPTWPITLPAAVRAGPRAHSASRVWECICYNEYHMSAFWASSDWQYSTRVDSLIKCCSEWYTTSGAFACSHGKGTL